MKISCPVTVVKWDEKDFSELEKGMKISKADNIYAISGEMQGNMVVQYTMFYSHFDKSNPHQSTSKYVGLIQFSGKISGKEGAFVLEDNGSFQNGMVQSEIKIIPNSGSRDLTGITGEGKYYTDSTGFFIELEFEFGNV